MPNSWFTHLECSVPCGAPTLDPSSDVTTSVSCGAPLLARYDLAAARSWTRDTLCGRESSMWRYRELMPVFADEAPVSLGEGFTPLVHAARLGRRLGLERLYIKDESLNPDEFVQGARPVGGDHSGSGLGVTTVSVPSAGQCRKRDGGVRGPGRPAR